MKRLLAILCCIPLLCGLAAGCHSTPHTDSSGVAAPTTTPAAAGTVDVPAIAYNREDTLNPFSATTQINLLLSTLLYESLFRPDTAFSPMPQLAKAATFTDNTHLAVTLRTGAVFSDGVAVKAEDVLYSFNKAKASANYSASLSNITAATAKKSTLTFTLATPDAYAAACLYFPVIRKSADTAAKAAAPVGSGPYVYAAATATLTVNPHAAVAKTAKNRTLRLVHLVSNATVLQNLESGNIHYMFDDLSDGSIPRTSAKNIAVDMPQLVYIGINGAKPLLSNAAFRKALSTGLDRATIASLSYAGRALAATSPFHPKWKAAAQLNAFSSTEDIDAAANLLKAAQAAPTASATTAAATTAASAAATKTTAAKTTAATTPTATTAAPLQFTLIYPAGNSCREAAVKTIVKQLARIDVTVTPAALSYADYKARLAAGNYDLYLGEIRLSPDMNLQPFLRSGGTAAYGVDTAGTAAQKYAGFRDGTVTVSDFITAFGEQMPYIPLCWRQGMAACNTAISYITPSAYAVFDGITN